MEEIRGEKRLLQFTFAVSALQEKLVKKYESILDNLLRSNSYFLTELLCHARKCCSCGNGIREPGESCDDGNNDDLDGCGAQCVLEEFFDCDNNIGDTTRCRHYAVNVNGKDNSMLDHFIWYSRRSDYVFLTDPEVIGQGHIGSEVWAKFLSC